MMKIRDLALLSIMTCMLSACQTPDISVPDISLPKLSLSRETPAPVEIGAQRIARETIPVDRVITSRAGDSIYSLAARYQVTPQSLIADNQLQAPYLVSEGQRLKITPPREHIVTAADSLFSISQRYAVSQYHLAELNQLQEPYELVVGQALLVPDTHDFSVLDGSKGVNTKLAKPAAMPAINREIVSTVAQPAPAKAVVQKNFVAPAFGANDGFTWPVKGEVISNFGPAGKGLHNDGVNIRAEAGTKVQTSAPGTIAYIGENLKSFGTLILVKHDGGYITAYAHLADINVKEGDVVGAGEVIGTVGATGRVSTPQLHFEVRKSRKPINPYEIISS